tara:strand:- start:255 stop:620 length:366 start_codon:yes stop_codon:yes gene_type:complete
MYFAPFINTEIVKMIKKTKKKSYTIGSAFAQNGGKGGKIMSKGIKGSSPAMAMSKRKPQVGFMTYKDYFDSLSDVVKDAYNRRPLKMEASLFQAYETEKQTAKTNKNIGSKRISGKLKGRR